MKSRLADRERLIHILDAIDEIKSYIKESDLKEFLSNSMMRFAAVKQVEIIGEAANHLSPEIKQMFSEIECLKLSECETSLFMNILESILKLYGKLLLMTSQPWVRKLEN